MNAIVTAWEVKTAIRNTRAAELIAANPKLIPVSDKTNSLIAAAKNIRIELKAAFPTVKFSVRSDRFSMGDSIDVSWTDGPSDSQVNDITSKYKAGSFDGRTDSYEYSTSAWTTAFGDAKYVSSHRTHSDALLARVIARVCTQYGVTEVPTVADWKRGNSFEIRDAMYSALRKHTCALPKQVLAICPKAPHLSLVQGTNRPQ